MEMTMIGYIKKIIFRKQRYYTYTPLADDAGGYSPE
jgi:hypothetical protein